jgi:hypothetical protein
MSAEPGMAATPGMSAEPAAEPDEPRSWVIPGVRADLDETPSFPVVAVAEGNWR